MIASSDRVRSTGIDRRAFLGALGAALAAGVPAAPPIGRRPVPLIHQTDLFRPHMDPDDHFDLACAYGLAATGAVNLLGVLCDAPPEGHDGDPDVAAAAMLNHLTGLNMPLVVGSPRKPTSRSDRTDSGGRDALRGATWLVDALRRSPDPVCITVVGSCRDVALAARRSPDVFRRKCRAVYLNAGTGAPDRRPSDALEYNVALDPSSYASMFDVLCPLYWMPCFERLGPTATDAFSVHRHGTYYRFTMRSVLDALSPPMQRFFLSMLERESGSRWLRSLREPVDSALLARWGAVSRNMWCTAAFLHLGGRMPPRPTFRFEPVRVKCDDGGWTSWEPGRGSPSRWKFEVTDVGGYEAQMTEALRDLIRPIGVRGAAQTGRARAACCNIT